jgi:hypothetical protein
MAVLMTAEVPGMTPDAYDGMQAALGENLRRAKGFISHAAGVTDGGGWRVTELWESIEDSTEWFAKNVQPMLPPGITPKRSFQKLHNLVRA